MCTSLAFQEQQSGNGIASECPFTWLRSEARCCRCVAGRLYHQKGCMQVAEICSGGALLNICLLCRTGQMMPPRLSQKGRLQVLYIVLEQTRLLHQETPLDRLLNISSSSLLICSDSLSWGPWSIPWGPWSIPCTRSQGSTSRKQVLRIIQVAG